MPERNKKKINPSSQHGVPFDSSAVVTSALLFARALAFAHSLYAFPLAVMCRLEGPPRKGKKGGRSPGEEDRRAELTGRRLCDRPIKTKVWAWEGGPWATWARDRPGGMSREGIRGRGRHKNVFAYVCFQLVFSVSSCSSTLLTLWKSW